jgi:hypothetical protein
MTGLLGRSNHPAYSLDLPTCTECSTKDVNTKHTLVLSVIHRGCSTNIYNIAILKHQDLPSNNIFMALEKEDETGSGTTYEPGNAFRAS